ncbi:hypothetical protein [Kribbella sp.]|uniref:hypothetical protein n=1 Tax=Kribbella sp. TaxID=1871183 RepID=UPI002D43D627|nr:hypothetical protein [Kribbella sp.]HZX07297.1 hypothetical protein [Kribbella sp.]
MDGPGAELLIGAVGPADLIPALERLAAQEFPELRLRTFVYDDEAETADLVQTGADVDGWLFTGVVPFSLARRTGVLRAPATYVRYRGTGLPRILGPLLADNPGTRSISIDTVPREQVQRLLRRVDLSPVHVRVLEHRPDRDAEDFLRFHRRVARDPGGSIAITCIRSVYTQLAPYLPTVRLLPAVASMRTALRAAASIPHGSAEGAADPVVGLVELSDPAGELARVVRGLAGEVVPLGGSRYLLFSTRERLVEVSSGFRELGVLDELRDGRVWGRIGFGAASTALAAERRARRALGRARAVGRFAAVVATTDDGELVIGSATPEYRETTGAPVPLAVAERRSGLEAAALLRLGQLAADRGGDGVTAADVATALGLDPRAARRTLQRLSAAGVVQLLDSAHTGKVGRPRKAYRVALQ